MAAYADLVINAETTGMLTLVVSSQRRPEFYRTSLTLETDWWRLGEVEQPAKL
jgi:hypothetical protein